MQFKDGILAVFSLVTTVYLGNVLSSDPLVIPNGADISSYCGKAESPIPRSGEEAYLASHPWVALIEYNKKGTKQTAISCSGAIISETHVLTVAACLDMEKIRVIKIGPPRRVWVGEYDLRSAQDCQTRGVEACNPPVQVLQVATFAYPSKYISRPTISENDIGLIKLEEKILWNSAVRPICLPSETKYGHLTNGMPLYTAGWGIYLDGTTSQVKREVRVPVVDRNRCDSQYKLFDEDYSIDENQVCAGNTCNDQKFTNLGSPLVSYQPSTKTWYLIGVSSFLLRYCGDNEPSGIFTNIVPYLDWINYTLQHLD